MQRIGRLLVTPLDCRGEVGSIALRRIQNSQHSLQVFAIQGGGQPIADVRHGSLQRSSGGGVVPGQRGSRIDHEAAFDDFRFEAARIGVHGQGEAGILRVGNGLVLDDLVGVASEAISGDIVEDDRKPLVGLLQRAQFGGRELLRVDDARIGEHGRHQRFYQAGLAAVARTVEHREQRLIEAEGVLAQRGVAQVAHQGRHVEPAHEREVVALQPRHVADKAVLVVGEEFEPTGDIAAYLFGVGIQGHLLARQHEVRPAARKVSTRPRFGIP